MQHMKLGRLSMRPIDPRYWLVLFLTLGGVLLLGTERINGGGNDADGRELPELFSELGGTLCYVRNQRMQDFKLVRNPLGEKGEQVFDLKGKASMLAFSRDGARIVSRYTEPEEELSSIAAFRPDRGRMGILVQEPATKLLGPRFAPADSALLYFRKERGEDKRVVLRPLNAGTKDEVRTLPCKKGKDCYHPDHHPSEDKVLYIQGKRTLIEYDRKGRKKDTLYRLPIPTKLKELKEFEGKSGSEILEFVEASDKDARQWKHLLRRRQEQAIAYPRYGPEGERVLLLHAMQRKKFRGGSYLLFDRNSGDLDTIESFGKGQRPTSACWVGNEGEAIAYGKAVLQEKDKGGRKGRRRRRRRNESRVDKSYRVYLHHIEKDSTRAVSRKDRFAYSPAWHP